MFFPLENTLKDEISCVIEKDDIHPRIYGIFLLIQKSRMIKSSLLQKSFDNFLYFYGEIYRCFHILLSDEKKPKKLNI